MAIWVYPGGAAALCHLGIYSSVAGAPGALLLDTGAASVQGSLPAQLSFTVPSFQVQPNTLYFLVVDCNGSIDLEASSATNALAGLLIGEPDLTTNGGGYVTPSSWSYAALPATFPTPVLFHNSSAAPNIYVQP